MEVLRVPVQTNKVNREFQCDFCPVSFGTLAANYEHVHNHFEEEICQNCDQRLLRIAGEWYVLHAAVTCVQKVIKTETISQEKHSDYEGQMATQFNDSSENQISSIELDPFEASDINPANNHVELLEPKHEIDLEYDITKSNPPDTVTEISLGELSIKFEEPDESQVEINDTSEDLQDVNNLQEQPQKAAITSVDHKGRKLWHCEYCPKKFNSNSNRYVHIIRVHGYNLEEVVKNNIISDLQCPICMKMFTTKYNVYIHTIRVHAPSTKQFKCSTCKTSFATRGELTQHIEMTPKICEFCDEQFCSKSMLSFHRVALCSSNTNRHDEQDEHRDLTYQSIDDVLDEEPNENDSEDIVTNNAKSELQCPICMKMFKKKYNVQIHTIRVHAPSMKQFKCSTCDVSFATRGELTLHNEMTPKICEFCNEKFCTKSMLRLHQVELCTSNTNKDDEQDELSDSFKGHQSFNDSNVKKGSNEQLPSNTCRSKSKADDENSGFYCVPCKKTSANNSSLEGHEIKVHNQHHKKFKCEKCKLTFATQSELYRHNEVRSEVCNVCNESFCTKSILEFHQTTYHSMTPPKPVDKPNEHDSEEIVTNNANSELQCPICMKIFKRKHSVYIHTIRVHAPSMKQFKCSSCEMAFATRRELTHHNEVTPKICEFCNEKFCTKSMLRFHKVELCTSNTNKDDEQDEHSDSFEGCGSLDDSNVESGSNEQLPSNKRKRKSTSDDESSKDYCAPRKRTFTNNFSLDRHNMNVHNINTYKCSECKEVFNTVDEMKKHTDTYLDKVCGKKKTRCHQCLEEFITPSKLKRHRDQPKKTCSICKRAFCTFDLLDFHQQKPCLEIKDAANVDHEADIRNEILPDLGSESQINESDELKQRNKRMLQNSRSSKIFKCCVCSKIFTKRDKFVQHYTFCAVRNKYKCDSCEFSCSSAKKLIEHKRSEHKIETRDYMCSFCGKSFAKKFQLQIHNNTHTGEKPFKCSFEGCSKQFASNAQRTEHMRLHTGEKPFQCPVEGCDRRFTYGIDLKRHKFSAHGIYTKKFPCQICSKIFPENQLLTKHMKQHSNQV